MCPSPFDHSKTLQGFEDKLGEYTRTAVCGRPFILIDKLQVWLRSQATPTVTHIERQVFAAYRHQSLPLPFRFSIFNPGKDCCLLIFSILHTFGRGDLIDCFSEEGKTDSKLPLLASDVEGIFRTANASNLAAVFLEKQHRFCPARFDFQKKANWNKDVVIPICSKEPINEGGTAHLWLINVPEEFIEESLRKESIGSRFDAGSKEDPDWVRKPLQLCPTNTSFPSTPATIPTFTYYWGISLTTHSATSSHSKLSTIRKSLRMKGKHSSA